MNYELTNETKLAPNGEVLYRIKAINDIPSKRIKKGNLGGWIGREAKLEDNAWISDEASVYGKSRISNDAHVFDSAQVFGNAHVLHHSIIFGNAVITDNANVCGTAKLFDNAHLSGTASVDSEFAKLVMTVTNKYSVKFTATYLFVNNRYYLRIFKKLRYPKKIKMVK